jgi:hypothetical protein
MVQGSGFSTKLQGFTDDHCLGWVGKVEADLLRRWHGVEGGLGVLLLRDGQVRLVDLFSFSHHDSRGTEAGVRRGDLQGLVVALERDEQVAVNCKNPLGAGIFSTR